MNKSNIVALFMECRRATLNLLNEGRISLASAICVRFLLNTGIDKDTLLKHFSHHPYYNDLKQIINIAFEDKQ